MSAIFYIVNVEGVITDGKRYLMAQRSEQEEHAPGGLSLPGGKVENAGITAAILEETLRREIREETGAEVMEKMIYLKSSAFIAADGSPVVDVVFLCRYYSGAPTALQPEEVAALRWMSAAEILADPDLAPWNRASILLAEAHLAELPER